MYTLDSIRTFREKFGKKKIILDTNLLLLLLVGLCDKKFLSQHGCTEKYTDIDHEILIKIFKYFDPIIVITPHILAEFSNLSKRDIKEPRIHYYIATVINSLKNYQEEQVSLERLLSTKVSTIALYGFTDISIIEAAKKIDAVILTDDIGLALYADTSRIPSIKFGAVKANSILTSVL